MALARLALNNLRQKVIMSCKGFGADPKHRRGSSLLRHLSSAGESGDAVAVSTEKNKSNLIPRRRRRYYGRNKDHHLDLVPAIWDLFPSGLGTALVQASENINRLLERLGGTVGRVREKEDHYKLRLDVPGLAKEELKITVEDGVLHIRGEHKELEEESESDEEQWWSARYGYYGSSLVLPEDAEPHEIKAEMRDGVLTLVIPKSDKPKTEAKEIKIQ